MQNKPPKIIVLCGPTASGKSDLAIRLARRFNGEIISADSRQVYRGMDIGTGKVSKREQRLVRHWLIDVASPTRQYSVARFKRDAQKAIRDIVRRGKLPIICGGTGFWIDALVYDQSLPPVKPDAKLRARLNKLSTSELFAQLSNLDPVRASGIDRHNPVRLIRALEIVLTTGRPVPARVNGSEAIPGSSSREPSPGPYETFYLGISIPKQKLALRIEKRLDARLNPPTDGGMIEEVRRLHRQGVSWKRLESFGLEYRWVARFLQGHLTHQQMHDGLLRDIIAYSKRQLTWWRANPDVVSVTNYTQAHRLVAKFLLSSETK